MKNITIHPAATIKAAMEALDKTAEKVLLVRDNEQKLIGTLTDGDIRRCILKEQNLSGSIENAYYKTPIFVFQDEYDGEKIKETLRQNKINLIPILDRNRRIVDFVTWEKAFGNDRKGSVENLNVPVVIMAGGSGTRLAPFTKVLPKPLIPVGEKPIIDHIIGRFTKYGFCELYLTVYHKSKILRAYFEEESSEYSICFAEESEPRGTAGSLRLLADKLDRPFFVSNCDIIVEADYTDIYRFHMKKGNDITLVASAKQYNIPYGICELDSEGGLARIREKPEYNFLVNAGMYVLNPSVLELIPDRQLFHITHLIDKVKKSGGQVGVYPVSEKAWIDIGQWVEYRKALKVIEDV